MFAGVFLDFLWAGDKDKHCTAVCSKFVFFLFFFNSQTLLILASLFEKCQLQKPSAVRRGGGLLFLKVNLSYPKRKQSEEGRQNKTSC